jgi:S1-C subfamily serine protease
VTLEKGGEQLSAEVWSWDPENDLALVKLPKGNLPAIAWAPEAVRAGAVGTRLYAVSGLGGAGAKAVSGMVIDQSTVGLQHNVPLSPDFLGGPLVTATGQVLAVATSTYRPLGFDPGPLPYAPDITTACRDQKVLVCPAALTGQR